MGRLSDWHTQLPAWMKSDIFIGLLTLLLWVGAAAFSFYVVLEFQQMVLRRYRTCCFDRWGFQVLRQWFTIFGVGLWLAFVIVTGEYHYQNKRQGKSWQVFNGLI